LKQNYYISVFLLFAFFAKSASAHGKNRLDLYHHDFLVLSDSLGSLSRIEKQVETIYYNGAYSDVIRITDSIFRYSQIENRADSMAISRLYYHRFESYYKLAEKEKSIAAADKGLAFCPEGKDAENLKAILFYKRAYSEYDKNRLLKSRRSMERSVAILESTKAPNLDYLIGAYIFLSSDAAHHGNLEEAKRFLRLAEKSYRRDKVSIDKAREGPEGQNDRYEVMLPYRNVYALYSLGTTQKDSLDLEKALSDLRFLSQQTEFGITYESIYITQALNHAASWFISKAEKTDDKQAYLQRALILLNEAIELTEEKGFSGLISNILYNKIRTLTEIGRLDEANLLIDRQLESLPPKNGLRPYYLAQKGLIELYLNNQLTAIENFRHAIALIHRGDEPLKSDFSNFMPSSSLNVVELLINIAAKLNQKYPENSDIKTLVNNFYKTALVQFESSALSSKFSPKYDQTLRQLVGGLFRTNSARYNEYPNLVSLLETAEKLKNQLEWKRFNQSRFTNNLKDIDSIRYKGLELRKQLVAATQTERVAIADSLQRLIALNEATVIERYPNLELMEAVQFELSELQKKLSADTVILKFMILQDDLAVFVITKNSVAVDLKVWNDPLRTKLDALVEELKNKKYPEDLSKEFGELLLSKAVGYNNVVVNPDTQLFKLPFEILVVNNQLALEAFNIRYTSSLGFIAPDVVKPAENGELAIYVPDYDNSLVSSTNRGEYGALLGAHKEALAISQYFTSNVYDKKNLTKQVFFRTASNAKLLHLAMHSEVDNELPELSKLLFVDTNAEDDNLYLEEIYGLDLSAELVVLSACNTGVGRENAGRSLESFQRAFTFAGVPAAIASLWEVPDLATKDIMKSFYENLKKGQSKSVALKNAKIAFKNQHKGSRLDQPFYWAGFVLYGVDDPVVTPSTFYYWVLMIGVILIVLVLWRQSRTYS
jgi:CHAT domain-containing protein/tetratricopeptide (TPR) repeat protein